MPIYEHKPAHTHPYPYMSLCITHHAQGPRLLEFLKTATHSIAHPCIPAHACACSHTPAHLYMHTHICQRTSLYARTCQRTSLHAHTSLCMLALPTFTHACPCTPVHARRRLHTSLHAKTCLCMLKHACTKPCSCPLMLMHAPA